MPKGYLVRLPPGAGKTRRVWESILRGAGKQEWKWKRRIQDTLILTPNPHTHRIWLTELAILAKHRKILPGDHSCEDLRGETVGKLKRLLEPLGVPGLDTFSHLKDRRSRPFKFLVLDEWHKLSNPVIRKCEAYSKGENVAGWFVGGKKVKKRVYFVSATPVNPVLENKVEDGKPVEQETPYDYDDERKITAEAIHRAASVMSGFTGKRSPLPEKTFNRILSRLGILEIASVKRSWRYPKELDLPEDPHPLDGDFLAEFLEEVDGGNNWVEEYAMAVGLVRTRRKKKRYLLYPSDQPKGRSFGIPYTRLYARHGKSGLAEKWLWDAHPRAKLLLQVLEQRAVVRRQGDRDYYLTGTRKALVFCTHQGVALGLTHTLRRYIGSDQQGPGSNRAIRTSVGSGDREGLTEAFNDPHSGLQILVATDALSESIDLHKSCQLVVHYELPWSPLRLLQRVGRLTRLITDSKGIPRFNKGVRVAHIVLPGSVEEERVHRLVRRIRFLHKERLWPLGATLRGITLGLIGSGPSLQLRWELERLSRPHPKLSSH